MPYQEVLADITYKVQVVTISIVIMLVCLAGIYGILYLLILWFKYRNREEKSLEYQLLKISIPRDNEIKIDAAEQMFSALASLRKSGFKSKFSIQPHISFEIVAKPGSICFYVCVPKSLQDLVEKQIYGAYPGADITEQDEYNIFSEKGEVAFASLRLKKTDYLPIRTFKDLPTDPLSSITSVLSKMQEGEGAAIQVIVSPSDGKWKSKGHSFIAHVKKQESDPEKARFQYDPKVLESINNKISKAGFDTVIRLVVSSYSKESAKMHLDNLIGSFSQFISDQNNFTKAKHLFKKIFIIDFIYRYFPIINLPYFPEIIPK